MDSRSSALLTSTGAYSGCGRAESFRANRWRMLSTSRLYSLRLSLPMSCVTVSPVRSICGMLSTSPATPRPGTQPMISPRLTMDLRYCPATTPRFPYSWFAPRLCASRTAFKRYFSSSADSLAKYSSGPRSTVMRTMPRSMHSARIRFTRWREIPSRCAIWSCVWPAS